MEKAAETATATAEEGRKRKITVENSELSTSSIRFKTRCLSEATPENSASSVRSGNSTCESVSSGGGVLGSCCSSSRLSELTKDSSKLADLEQGNEVTVDFFATSAGVSADFTERREKSSNEAEEQSGDLESTPMPRDSNSRRRSTTVKMPSEAELEEFFATAEKNLHKQFADKYNYDVVKDEPMEGRYEWIPVQFKPCSMKKKQKKNKKQAVSI
ncbi:cyclin-dependent kinase inhibitor 7-like [Andrographis paniculata]|uniref:cyclin-dependent kinase inhibitor 7-like n=1 Tax=Andrographis paniculata TaxID=175694 RepID=UPI0021E6E8DD|nr:cyclin-dependent kinase inhibitor 7-like [Andrographis paniculata]